MIGSEARRILLDLDSVLISLHSEEAALYMMWAEDMSNENTRDYVTPCQKTGME